MTLQLVERSPVRTFLNAFSTLVESSADVSMNESRFFSLTVVFIFGYLWLNEIYIIKGKKIFFDKYWQNWMLLRSRLVSNAANHTCCQRASLQRSHWHRSEAPRANWLDSWTTRILLCRRRATQPMYPDNN